MSKRTLTRSAPDWIECEVCDGAIEHTTYADCPEGKAYDGDDLRCTKCGSTGSVTVCVDDVCAYTLDEPATDWGEMRAEVERLRAEAMLAPRGDGR